MILSKTFLIEMINCKNIDDITTWENKEDAIEYAVETMQTCLNKNYEEYLKPFVDLEIINQNKFLMERTLSQWKLIMKDIECYTFLEDKFKWYEREIQILHKFLKFLNKLITQQENEKINNEFNIELHKRKIDKIMQKIHNMGYEIWGKFRVCFRDKD